MNLLLNVVGVAVVVNGFIGGFCVLISFLNRGRGDYTGFLVYGLFSIGMAILFYRLAPKIEKKIREAEKKDAPSSLQPKHRVFIAVCLAMVVYFLFRPGTPRGWSPFEVAQPIQVSSYQRYDGTSVSEYQRAEPGDRALALDVNRDRIAVWRARVRDYEKQRNRLLLVCALIVGAGVFWPGRPQKNA